MTNHVPMKKIVLLFITFFSIHSFATAERNYNITNVDITAEIQSDGSISYSEVRSYEFRGDFSQGEYILPRSGFDSADNFRVFEGERLLQRNQSDRPGNYDVKVDGDFIIIRWHYETLGSTDRKNFTIAYDLYGALTTGNDYAQWFWNFLDGPSWGKRTENLSITLIFQDDIPQRLTRIWTRSAASDFDINIVENRIHLTGGPVSRREHATFRILFPTSLIPEAEVTNPDLTLGFVEADEQQYQTELALREMRAAQRKEWATFGSYALFGFSLLLALYAFFKYRPQYTRKLREEFAYEPPNIHPVLADWLLNQRIITDKGKTAGIFNLARLGYFKIRESDKKIEHTETNDFIIEQGENTDLDTLPDWDKSMVNYVNNNIRNGNPELSYLFKNDTTEQWTWYANWKKLISNAAKEKHWYNHENTGAMIVNMSFHGLIMIASIVAILYTWTALLPMIFALCAMIGSYGIVHLTDEGYELFTHLKAYRKALKEKSPDHFDRDKLQTHFIFSILFGLNEKVFKQQFQDAETQNISWLMISTGSIYSMGGFSSTISSAAAYSTSGSISGGGASISSAGGGAGGGMR